MNFGEFENQTKHQTFCRSMGPVDEMNEVYSLDCYFRQTWIDKRLRSMLYM